ncbi:MAG: LamG domain-containing protein, partial [Planctomycetaceae bacterium]|nr:LamG domain-containing protein [Planctomycetaceae bacterium]
MSRRFFDGEIDFVAVYDTALTGDEVEDLYEEKDNWNLTLTVPTNSNGTTAAFSENHEDTFNVTINRTNNNFNADKSYPINFDLTFSG